MDFWSCYENDKTMLEACDKIQDYLSKKGFGTAKERANAYLASMKQKVT
ncbi:hypothetical protein PU629_13365 [Pullulanibacillus sp. KACC 23026]|nr:hypothetical protein [Pullulanibacillus sp. KACC 23026]WEG11157.1 hypothetical protein PU629_13365 [Pullulanibacillus sp. KACC 23026]